ncbi:MAG: hypothetical protein K2X38_03690 [Gemmataceae bacterium]|nr:hypothetical protein [Gemmataceae bacterium]
MTPKERLQALVDELPDNASTALVARETLELAKLMRSLDDVENGRLIDHEDVAAEFEAMFQRAAESSDRVEALLNRHGNRAIDVPLVQLVSELLQSAPSNLAAEQLIQEIEWLDRRGKPVDEAAICKELGMTHDELFGEDADDDGPVQSPVVPTGQMGLPRVDRPH